MSTYTLRNTRFGFSLIELITAIAIISILASILIPAVGKIRSSANSAKSASNLRQFGVAIQAYTADNKGKYPVTWGQQEENGPKLLWHHEISEYMSMEDKPNSSKAQGYVGSLWSTYISPTTIAPRVFDSNTNYLISTYSMNGNLNERIKVGNTFLNMGVPTFKVENPANTVLLVDGGQWDIGSQADANIGKVRNETRNSSTPDQPIKLSEPNKDGLYGWGTVSYRDNDRAATLWCDGHVSHVNKGDFKHKHFNITM